MLSVRFPLVALCVLLAFSTPAFAQVPTGTTRMVVGFAPGGGNDILARLYADKLSARLKSSFVVENRPGANGVVAVDAVRRAEANGRTILVGPSSAMTTNPILVKSVQYDPVRDFEPIAMIGSFPLVIVVRADSPLRTLADLVAAAKAKPGEVNYSSAASSFQLATEAFAQRAGIKMQNVAYRGSAPAATGLLSGDVTLNFGDVSAVLPLVQAGEMRALAVTTQKRISSLPDTPTIAESGYPGFEMVFWSGLFLPAGTPEDIRSKLEGDVREISGLPDVLDRMSKLGIEPAFTPGPQLRQRMAAELAAYREVAEKAGIKQE